MLIFLISLQCSTMVEPETKITCKIKTLKYYLNPLTEKDAFSVV